MEEKYFGYFTVKVIDRLRGEQLNVGVVVFDTEPTPQLKFFESNNALARARTTLRNISFPHVESMLITIRGVTQIGERLGKLLVEDGPEGLATFLEKQTESPITFPPYLSSILGQDIDEVGKRLLTQYVD